MAKRGLLVVLCLVAVGLTSSSQWAAGQTSGGDRLDLATIVLSPEDPGLSSFLHQGAFDESLAAEANLMASYLGFTMTPAEMEVFLEEQGWQRKYVSRMVLPSQQNAGHDVQIVKSYVTEYQSEDGAHAAFAVLENEERVPDAVDLDPSRMFGNETDLTSDKGFDSENRQYQSLDLSFQSGSRIAGVEMVVYPSAAGSSPEQGKVEALAGVMEERLSDPPLPGVGFSLARLEPGAVVTLDDAYFRYELVDLPMTDETETSREQRVATYANAVDVYQLFQNVQGMSGAALLYSLTIYQFPTDRDAQAWLEGAQSIIEENSYYGELEPVSETLDAGDQHRAFRFGPYGDGNDALIVLNRTGSVIHRIQLVPTSDSGSVPLALGTTLATEQLECFETLTCVSVPVPAETFEFLDAPSATPAA